MKSLVGLVIIAASMSAHTVRADGEVQCTHYWKTNLGLVASHKAIGLDVGESAYGSEGLYQCSVNLTAKDALSGKYLYIGEVGDSSYLEVISESNQLSRLPIVHGLSPNGEERPKYLRFFPFVVPIRDVYQRDGEHRLIIHYLDIVKKQTGIRSGPPTVESLSGVIKKFIWNSPGITYHLIQALALMLILGAVIFWRGVTLKRRLLFSASVFCSVLTVISITAIPRFLFDDPNAAIRWNDYINVLSFSILLVPLSQYLRSDVRWFWPTYFGVQVGCAILTSLSLSRLSLDSRIYLPVYCGSLGLFAGVGPTILGLLTLKKRLLPIGSPRPLAHVGVMLIVLGSLMVWDTVVNALIFDMRWYFVVHYFYFGIALLIPSDLQVRETAAEKRYSLEMNRVKEASLRDLLREDVHYPLSRFAEMIGVQTGAKRVSILEVAGTSQKFLGHFGHFRDPAGTAEVLPGSPLHDMLAREAMVFGQSLALGNTYTNRARAVHTEYVVVPLRHNGKVSGALCLTDFLSGYLMPFFKERLESVQMECDLLFSLLMSERQNRSKAKLLQLSRLKTNPIQIDSEKYFLENCKISQELSEPAFIVGDLADSTPLRANFGSKVQQALDAQLRFIFERFKHLGIILNREKGDFVSISVLNQQADVSRDQAVQRAFTILQFLADPGDEFRRIPKSYGVISPFLLRVAMSHLRAPLGSEGESGVIPVFNQLCDSEIDMAARVIDKVAYPGECVVLETAYLRLKSNGDLIQLAPQRLKGILNAPKLYTVRPVVRREQAVG